VGSELTAESFLATKIAFLVISGAATTVIGSAGVWAALRAGRAAFVFARSRLAPPILQRWVALRVRKLALHASTASLDSTPLVRLVGVVESDNTAMAEFSGSPSVVSGHEVGERGGGSVERSLTALDFSLRLQDGNKVKVLAHDAANRNLLRLLDGEPHRWRADRQRGGWFCESRLAPGDQVEVIGSLSRRIDPNAERISDRQPALSWTVIAGKQRLSLRFRTRMPVALK
jgi:hypothetical protein